MTDAEALLPKLADIIRRELNAPGAEIARGTTADDVDGWDSLAHARLMLAVEQAFDIRLPGARLFDLETVGDLADLVTETLATTETRENAV